MSMTKRIIFPVSQDPRDDAGQPITNIFNILDETWISIPWIDSQERCRRPGDLYLSCRAETHFQGLDISRFCLRSVSKDRSRYHCHDGITTALSNCHIIITNWKRPQWEFSRSVTADRRREMTNLGASPQIQISFEAILELLNFIFPGDWIKRLKYQFPDRKHGFGEWQSSERRLVRSLLGEVTGNVIISVREAVFFPFCHTANESEIQ